MFWICTMLVLVTLCLVGTVLAEYAEEIEELVNEAKYMWNDRKRLRVE